LNQPHISLFTSSKKNDGLKIINCNHNYNSFSPYPFKKDERQMQKIRNLHLPLIEEGKRKCFDI